MINTNTILISIVAPLLIALLVSLITAYLALRRFRKERMWELKVNTYDGIFDALYDFDEFFRTRLLEEIDGELLEDEDKEELIIAYDEASYDLGSVLFKGEFIINKRAVDLLNELDYKLQVKEPGFWEDLITGNKRYKYFQEQRSLISKATKELRNIARKELKTYG